MPKTAKHNLVKLQFISVTTFNASNKGDATEYIRQSGVPYDKAIDINKYLDRKCRS